MTKLVLTLLVLRTLVVPIYAADVSGVWGMTLKADWTTIPDVVCTLSQDGQDLMGSCKPTGASSREAVNLTGGKVDGSKVSCRWNVVTPDGQTWTYALTGILDAKGTMIEGTFTLSNTSSQGKGSFTAKKQ